ncbi:MAG: rhomboid family intramembrane serine protease [Ilumatobacteraceae bacterium]
MAFPSPPPVPSCYRHADREGGRNCTRCGRPACGDCLVQATVGSHCLDCAKASQPDIRTRVRHANARVLTPATYALIGINLLVFAAMVLADASTLGGGSITTAHAELGLSRDILQNGLRFTDGSTGDAHQWYRLVTAGFIHFGVFHILMNMLLLYQLGMLLERELGSLRFSLLYVASLLTGSLGVLLVEPFALSGGASGAVFGLMAAAAVGLHRRGVNVFSTGIGTTLILNLVLTFTISGISIGGHVGGALGGAACGWVMMAPRWKPTAEWARWAMPALLAAAAVIASVVVVG